MTEQYSNTHKKILSLKGVDLVPLGRKLCHRENEISLHPKTFRIARLLFSHSPHLVSSNDLITAAWVSPNSEPEYSEKCIFNEINKLRGSLKRIKAPLKIENRRGIGYQIFSTSYKEDRSPSAIEFNGVIFDPVNRTLHFEKTNILNPQTFQIAKCLFMTPNRPVPFYRLYKALWPQSVDQPLDPTNTIKVIVSTLRRMLRSTEAPVQIASERGFGFTLVSGSAPKEVERPLSLFGPKNIPRLSPHFQSEGPC